MSGIARIRWDQPRLTQLPQPEGQLRRRDMFSWQEVMTLLAKQEMEIRRLHAALHDGALGAIRIVLEVRPGEVKCVSSSADPLLQGIADDVVHRVTHAGFPTNLAPVRVEIGLHFEAAGGHDAWSEEGWSADTWGESADRGRGGSGGSFGEPF